MSRKLWAAARILGGLLVTLGVLTVLGSAGGSDQGTLSTYHAFIFAICGIVVVMAGSLLILISGPRAIRRRAVRRMRQDVVMFDIARAEVFQNESRNWYDQIPSTPSDHTMRALSRPLNCDELDEHDRRLLRSIDSSKRPRGHDPKVQVPRQP